MDDTRPFDAEEMTDRDFPVAREEAPQAPPEIGTDERRMHVRAYNYWVSLLDGRPFPTIGDLDPTSLTDFAPNSVLMDFTKGPGNPAIPYLGRALREDGGIEEEIRTIADVPGRSLLSRLTDHYLEIIANRAPVGFEAEFVAHSGLNTLYRGILMPFSSDGAAIDFIYGVINWKVSAGAKLPDDIIAAIDTALAEPRPAIAPAPVWADGPSAAALEPAHEAPFEDYAEPELDEDAGLYDVLAAARETADTLKAADGRSRAALYRALGLAYDFALVAEQRPEEYSELLGDNDIAVQARAPMTPIVKLVFGVDYDKTRLTEFAAALSYGRRQCLAVGMLRGFLESHPGGLKGVVAAERRERRPAIDTDTGEAARAAMRAMPAAAVVDMGPIEGEFVLIMGRREANGGVALLGPVPDDATLLDRAMRRLAQPKVARKARRETE
jgi:hypothetical protein